MSKNTICSCGNVWWFLPHSNSLDLHYNTSLTAAPSPIFPVWCQTQACHHFTAKVLPTEPAHVSWALTQCGCFLSEVFTFGGLLSLSSLAVDDWSATQRPKNDETWQRVSLGFHGSPRDSASVCVRWMYVFFSDVVHLRAEFGAQFFE